MSKGELAKGKVLVVEDEPFLVKALAHKLESSGFDVEVAMDGQEGVAKAETFRPDLVLLDILMPKMSGYEVIKLLKESEVHRHIPVVFLSNFGDKSEIEKGMSLGARDYFVKANLKLADLIDKIGTYIVEGKK